jgi:succinate dehydrogenase/fumarate reductase flavoprotein subunit
MVLGWWAGEHAANYAKEKDLTNVRQEQVELLSKKTFRHLGGGDGKTFDEVHGKAAQVLTDLGVILSDEKLIKARNALLEILSSFDNVKAKDPHGLVKVLGLRNSLEALTAVLECLFHRRESRGSVINSDHPETDNENWLSLTKSRMDGSGKLQIWDDPIPAEEYYIHYKPKPGKSLHPFFKVVGKTVESSS